jgi:hypothetical protein
MDRKNTAAKLRAKAADPGATRAEARALRHKAREFEHAAHQETLDRARARPLLPGERAVVNVFGPTLQQSEAEYRAQHQPGGDRDREAQHELEAGA